VSTETAVESAQTDVESAHTVESHDLTSVVDVPFPQDANATIANKAAIFLIIVCFYLFVFNVSFLNL
jgi:hypothetical protein